MWLWGEKQIVFPLPRSAVMFSFFLVALFFLRQATFLTYLSIFLDIMANSKKILQITIKPTGCESVFFSESARILEITMIALDFRSN